MIENSFDAMRASESVTCKVKFDIPDVVGMPVIAPVEVLRVSPGGILPEVIDQVQGGDPPMASGVRLYGTLTMPGSREFVVMPNIEIVNCLAAVAEAASKTCAVKV